ncbi:GNAT family N-acetyltransferase [Celeribacter ethanolicus]|uniref:GNAT family N-acetyltransferase n=1 Tax=Celeribacter ethanolicus TaxID=1758178 RepID=A0A291G8J1_9RHOB|nr:GNAT family N-acetyltransferase [Celeribacter ethanolicus]ATG46350.1 GNAT family N-acetyltransferase [Celeribacter ethanolicus]
MTITHLTLRRFEAGDTMVLSHIWRAASERAHPFFSQEQLDQQQALVEQVYLPKAETWVALRGAVPLGFIGLLPDAEVAIIGGLFVAPEAQGQGIGRMLVDHARRLKHRLSLEVYETNASARDFYARLGFRQTGRREVDDNGLPYPLLKLVL